MLRCVRWFGSSPPALASVERIVPYVAKGTWVLPGSGTKGEGTPAPTPSLSAMRGVRAPKDWRDMRQLPQWKRQMFALQEKFPRGWAPQKKLSRDKMDELRAMKKAMPQITATELGSHYRISPEAVRRILKSSWRPNEGEERAKMDERWARRGHRVKQLLETEPTEETGHKTKK